MTVKVTVEKSSICQIHISLFFNHTSHRIYVNPHGGELIDSAVVHSNLIQSRRRTRDTYLTKTKTPITIHTMQMIVPAIAPINHDILSFVNNEIIS